MTEDEKKGSNWGQEYAPCDCAMWKSIVKPGENMWALDTNAETFATEAPVCPFCETPRKPIAETPTDE
jgi:hypothetical protein